jgi:hypothetical protein
MTYHRLQFHSRHLIFCIAIVAILCSAPNLVRGVFEQDSIRHGVYYMETIAERQRELAVLYPEGATRHRFWYDAYADHARKLRSKIGWQRLTSLALIGGCAGLIGWTCRLRWIAAGAALSVMTALLFCSEVNARSPWDGAVGLSTWHMILTFVSVQVTFVLAMVGGRYLLATPIFRRKPYLFPRFCRFLP